VSAVHGDAVYAHLMGLLDGVPHEAFEHRPIRSADDAAEVRGTPLEQGVKALLMKLGKVFHIVAIPADRRLHGATLRKGLGLQRYRFARPEELQRLTGLQPGSVPPVGHVFDLPLVLDEALADRDPVVFTLGRPDRSVRLARADFLALARPDRVAPVTAPPQAL
jgi:Ala-tRNA(Pro) deacylase